MKSRLGKSLCAGLVIGAAAVILYKSYKKNKLYNKLKNTHDNSARLVLKDCLTLDLHQETDLKSKGLDDDHYKLFADSAKYYYPTLESPSPPPETLTESKQIEPDVAAQLETSLFPPPPPTNNKITLPNYGPNYNRFIKNYIFIDGNIDSNMVDDFSNQYQGILALKTPDVDFKVDIDINIIIRSFGGDDWSVLKIINIIAQHRGKFTCWIHQYVRSCGTLIALSCNNIILRNNSKLTPIHKIVPGNYYRISRYSFLKLVTDKDLCKKLGVEYRMVDLQYRCFIHIVRYIIKKHNIERRDLMFLFCNIFMNDKIKPTRILKYQDFKEISLQIQTMVDFGSEVELNISDKFSKRLTNLYLELSYFFL